MKIGGWILTSLGGVSVAVAVWALVGAVQIALRPPDVNNVGPFFVAVFFMFGFGSLGSGFFTAGDLLRRKAATNHD